MTAWALSFGWNWLLFPVAVWLTTRFWKATRQPSLKYIEHTVITQAKPFSFSKENVDFLLKMVDHLRWPNLHPTSPPLPESEKGTTYLLTVLRRERMFPWRRNSETWLVSTGHSTRESDGQMEDGGLHRRFLGIVAVAQARKIETEELTK